MTSLEVIRRLGLLVQLKILQAHVSAWRIFFFNAGKRIQNFNCAAILL